MSITKKALADKIKRRFGAPMVKVELDDSQIYDSIDYARDKFIKWAAGQATHEVWFTVLLFAGVNFYDMPVGIKEIVGYGTTGISSGINTLFTIENFLYNQGLYESLWATHNQGYSIISYHIARDFLETVRKYTPDKYNWKYHRYTNQLEIQPAPTSGAGSITVDNVTYDSPGYILLRGYMVEGASYNTQGTSDNWSDGDSDEDFYTNDWIFDYAFAHCKEILGRIRSKFENFASIGNTGIALDGQQLLQEAETEKERLRETLQLEETWDGLGVEIGW
jgi:hypothetical protein